MHEQARPLVRIYELSMLISASFSSPIGCSCRLINVGGQVSPARFLISQSQVIIVQIEPLERVHSNQDVSQGGVRSLNLKSLVQVRTYGSLIVVIQLI